MVGDGRENQVTDKVSQQAATDYGSAASRALYDAAIGRVMRPAKGVVML